MTDHQFSELAEEELTKVVQLYILICNPHHRRICLSSCWSSSSLPSWPSSSPSSPLLSTTPSSLSPTATASAVGPTNAPTPFDPVLDATKSLVIDGIKAGSEFGVSTAISSDGSIIVVGAKNALNKNRQMTGAVYIYSLDAFISGQRICWNHSR